MLLLELVPESTVVSLDETADEERLLLFALLAASRVFNRLASAVFVFGVT